MSLPAAPTGLTATANSNGTVSLSWTANSTTDAVIEYRIYRTSVFWFDPELVAAVAGTLYTDTSDELLPTTQWYYFVVAVNLSGTSPASTAASVTIPLPLPTAPTGLSATVNTNDTVSLSWAANPVNQQVTGYQVYREPYGSTSATLLATVSGTSYTDTSSVLTAGSSWTYYVEAVNATGASPASTVVSITIPQPLALDGSAHLNFTGTSGSLSLTTTNANDVIIVCVQVNGTTISSVTASGLTFTLRKRQATTDSPPNYEEVWYAVASSPLSNTTITITPSASTTYCTVDVFGISGADTTTIFDGNSSLPAATTNGPVTVSTSNANDFIFGTYRLHPQIPTGGTGWTVISAADYQLVEYQIVTSTQSNLQVALGSGDSSSGAGYAGIGDAIVGKSPESTSLPTAPTGLSATANANDTVSLSWTANPANQQVTGYQVYREPAGSTAATLLATVSGTSYTDTGGALTAGSQWTYYVEAVNAAGTSPPSSSVSVTIPASGRLIASFSVNNYGSSPLANPQMTFAHPFAPGDIPSGNILQLRKSDGTTIIPVQQDQESTWLQDNSWKTVAISAVSPDTFAAGQTITYQLWSAPGSPDRTPNVTLAQLTANTDIKFLFTGYDLGTDTFMVSVNDIVKNGQEWPWTVPQVTTTGTITNGSTTLTVNSASGITVGQAILTSQGLAPNTYVTAISGTTVTMSQQAYASASGITVGFLTPPTQGWEVIRSGPICTEWRFWSVFKRVSDGAFHYWLRGVIFVRAWGANGPFEIGGYWGIFNAFGPNFGGSVGASKTQINKYAFTATLQDGNTVIAHWGGANDFRTTTVAQTAINTANNTIALTATQAQNLLGVGYFQYENHPGMGVPVVLSSTGTMPGGLSAGTPYWITSTNPPNISFCPTRLDAEQATNIIAITSQGSGTLSITPLSAAYPWVPTLALGQDGNRVWYAGASGAVQPTLLVAHDFTYLTTKSRFLPPYLANLTVDSTVSPPALVPFSQGAVYFPSNIGGTGETEQDDRIGYLTWHSACALYRPFDLNLHRLNIGIALSYFEYSTIIINDIYTTLPVVNVTYYPNYGTPVGPNARWGYHNGYTADSMGSSATIDNSAGIDDGGAHNPCPAMLPYLQTGDFLYYELLAVQCNTRMAESYYGEVDANGVYSYKAWSVMNGGQGGTANSSWYTTPDWDYGDGAQVRGIGWLMRIHGVMMHFMPANRPEAQYLRDQTYGIASIPNQLVQYIPSSIGALGVYGGINNDETAGSYYNFNLFQHYMMFLCWAMEAWKGEYPQLVNFVTNYLSRIVVGQGNEAWGGSPQGCIFGMNLYEAVAADPNGNYVSTWDQMLNYSANYNPQTLNFTDLCSITQGGTTITLANGIANIYNIGTAPGWFVQTINFNDFPAYTIVTARSGNQLTTGPAPGTSGNAQAAATRGIYTAQTSAASAKGTTTLTFSSSSFPAGVVVGMGVQDITSANAIPIVSGFPLPPYIVTAITSSGGTTTVTLNQPIGLMGGSVAAGDTIRFGTVVSVSSLPIPWPGIATLIQQTGLKDMICLDGGAEYINSDSYINMVTSGLGVASILYSLNGSAALANAVNIYNEIRRRQYLGTYNPPLSFTNAPKWAIGPIGATQ